MFSIGLSNDMCQSVVGSRSNVGLTLSRGVRDNFIKLTFELRLMNRPYWSGDNGKGRVPGRDSDAIR